MKRRFIGILLALICFLQMTATARPTVIFDEYFNSGNTVQGICAKDNFAFVMLNNGVKIYDISDEENVTYLASVSAVAKQMVPAETRLYMSTGNKCIYIDYSSIKKGKLLTYKTILSEEGCSVGVVNNYLFISSEESGAVYVRDTNNSRFPLIATLGNEYVGMTIKNNKAAVSTSAGYDIYDLSGYAGESSLAGFKLGTVPNPGNVSAIDFKDNYVFIGNNAYPSSANRLYAYKINENGTYKKLWEYTISGYGETRISDVVTKGSFLYVAGQDAGKICLLNIENPEEGPAVLSSADFGSERSYPKKIAVAGGKIIASAIGIDKVEIFDVAGKLSGKALNIGLKLYPSRIEKDITVVSGANVRVKLMADNYTSDEINGTVILASYDGDKLVECKTSAVTVEAGKMNQVFTLGKVQTWAEQGCSVKAMLWEGNKPVMENITAEYCEDVQYEIYVDAENGSDSGEGTEDSPFRTLQRAKDEVRKLTRSMTNDIYVYLSSGNYYVEDTVVFNAEDSGNNGHNVIYKAYNGAEPVINGGVEITDWTLHDSAKNIYKASAKGIYTRQLYVNGTRAVRARSTGGLTSASADDGSKGLTCSNTEIAKYEHPEELEFVFKGRWLLPRIKAVSATAFAGTCYITMQQPYWNDAVNAQPDTSQIRTPWYYENAYELLDSRGEFYIDKYTDTVYYKPRFGEDIKKVKAYLPKEETLISIKGSNMFSPARNITFEGITFANTAWDYPLEEGRWATQNNIARQGSKDTPLAVTVECSENITFKGCTFRNMGGGGLGATRGFKNCNIIGNEFYDISAWSMNIGEYDEMPKEEKYINDGIEINNNYIHDVAVEYMDASAMSIGFPSNTVIRNNEIYNTPYSAIHVGLGWDVYATTNIKNMVIRNNYIHEIMTVLGDGGAIYTNGATGGTNANPNLIYRNYCKNQYNDTSVIYTDEGACYWRVEENVIDMEESDSVWKSRYGSTWTSSIHDVHYVRNFVTRNSILNGSTLCTYTGVQVKSPGSDWPAEAKAIIAAAGLEDEYKYLLED